MKDVMTIARRSALGLLLAAALSLPARPARACKCVSSTAAQIAAAADAVFEGRVLSGPTAPSGNSSADPVRYAFEVARVYKGDVGTRVTVATAVSGASCGASFTVGTSYLVYARLLDGQLSTTICWRNPRADLAAADREALGPGSEPRATPDAGTPDAAVPADPADPAGCSLGGRGAGAAAPWLLAVAAGVVLRGRRRG